MTTRSDNDRLEKLEASRDEMRKTMGEIKASLAEISRWLWKKQMGEIKANLAMVSKVMGLAPTEGQSTATPQQEGVPTATSPTTALTCNSTQNRDDLEAGKNQIFKEQSVEDWPSRLGNTKSKIDPHLDSNSVLIEIIETGEEGVNMTVEVHKVIENKELTTQDIEIEKLAPENRGLAAIPANVRQDLAVIKHEWQSVHTHIADAVPKKTWVDRNHDDDKCVIIVVANRSGDMEIIPPTINTLSGAGELIVWPSIVDRQWARELDEKVAAPKQPFVEEDGDELEDGERKRVHFALSANNRRKKEYIIKFKRRKKRGGNPLPFPTPLQHLSYELEPAFIVAERVGKEGQDHVLWVDKMNFKRAFPNSNLEDKVVLKEDEVVMKQNCWEGTESHLIYQTRGTD